ncbi:MAG: hypothetical protein ACXWPG_04380 [Ktedonobacteraceae bacterium]
MAQKEAKPQVPKIVALSMLLYRWLLNLGPASFRRDYGKPALQDFSRCCRVAYQKQGSLGVLRLWPGLLGETVSGLLAEHWTELFGRKRPILPTIQRSMVATFGAFVLFLFAYAAFGRIVDPVAPFDAVSRIHPEVALTYTLVAYGGKIALLALVLGELPILLIALKQAISGGPRSVIKLFLIKPRQALFLLGAAVVITVGSLGFLLATQYIFGSTPCTATNGCIAGQPPLLFMLDLAVIIGSITLGVFVVLAISTSLSLVVLRSEFGTGMLRFALVPIGIIALAMATTTVAASIWTIRLWVDAPQFAASGSGLGDGQTVWIIAFITAMAVSTVVTIGAFTSGLRSSLIRAS